MGTRPDLPPALILQPGLPGSLAAIRSLGRAGVPVVVGTGRLLEPGRWSKYTTHRTRGPRGADWPSLAAWLTGMARGYPGAVFIPTADTLAWSAARHLGELERGGLRLVSAPLTAVHRLMDKGSLAAAARHAGVPTPRTWLPADRQEAARVASEVSYPALAKPRCGMTMQRFGKATVVNDGAELLNAFDRQSRLMRLPAEVRAYEPGLALPMVQELRSGGAVYSLAGYVSRAGDVYALGSRKVRQTPPVIGVGLHFEAAPVRDDLLAGIERLCRGVGYHGIFEAEFVGDGELIDFNTRCYHEMAFEIARGLDVPLLAYADAIGDVALASAATAAVGSGRATGWELGRPLARSSGGAVVHAFSDRRDRLPGLVRHLDLARSRHIVRWLWNSRRQRSGRAITSVPR